MKKTDSLFLHEEILLLALRDEEGTIESGTMYRFAMGGSALAELLLAGRIRIDRKTKNKLVEATGTKPLGDPFLDECLLRVRNAKRRAGAGTWVSRFAQAKNLKNRIAEGLCRRGILREEEETVLLLFSRRIFPERNPRFEKAVLERLHEAIFTDTRDLDTRTVVLVALANQTGILKAAFGKKRLKGRKPRIEAIVKGDACGEATKAAIQAMQAAIMVCCIVPVVTT